jgi:hypothetical protein
VFLSWQAHFLHSHRRCGFILAGGSSGAEPGSESGLLRKNFVAASSTTPRVPVYCSRLRRSEVLFPGHSSKPDTRLNHLVHQTIKNENTLREDCMRRSCSCIQSASQIPRKDKLYRHGANGEGRMHHRLSEATVEAVLTGGAPCAPATPGIASHRYELSCRCDVA